MREVVSFRRPRTGISGFGSSVDSAGVPKPDPRLLRETTGLLLPFTLRATEGPALTEIEGNQIPAPIETCGILLFGSDCC